MKRQSGSHRTLERPDWPDFVFAFHDDEEVGPKMLARIASAQALRPKISRFHIFVCLTAAAHPRRPPTQFVTTSFSHGRRRVQPRVRRHPVETHPPRTAERFDRTTQNSCRRRQGAESDLPDL